MKYQLEITENQAQIIENALDFYSRIQMGQFDELISNFSSPLYKDLLKNNPDYDKLKFYINELKKEILPELSINSFYSIGNKSRPDSSRISFDLIQVIRYRLSWDKYPEGGIGVNFDKPMKFSTTESLAKIKKIEE